MKNTVDLFRIFQHEQKRVGDSMTVYYNIEENSLQYKNTKGTGRFDGYHPRRQY